MRIVIVGAGVMGCATALELKQRGVREVVVLDQSVPGAEASSAAAGMLAAQIESRDDAELDSFVAARNAYREWTESLYDATGIDVGYRRSGALCIFRDQALFEQARLRVEAQRARGLACELVDGASARHIDQEIATDILGAAYFPDEAQVDPPRLMRALLSAATRAGVTIRSGTTVSALVTEGGRCVGVSAESAGAHAREVLRGDAVVLAAGSWSSLVPGVPRELPRVRPVRGQILMLDERSPRLRCIVFSDHAYVVPRGDGRVVCGATMENVGHRREITASGISTVLNNSLRIAPCLGEAAFVSSWCNFRPQVVTPSQGEAGAPLVGASSLPGLFVATGHHRNGILLAKAAAVAVASAIGVQSH
ncbi:MAG: glycine oxidase ThiO [Polyangiaceae bacterium]|nr:glycine oxidase ThiO [Polyangiaceae bacterium]